MFQLADVTRPIFDADEPRPASPEGANYQIGSVPWSDNVLHGKPAGRCHATDSVLTVVQGDFSSSKI